MKLCDNNDKKTLLPLPANYSFPQETTLRNFIASARDKLLAK